MSRLPCLPIQLSVNGFEKAEKDSSVLGILPPLKEILMELLASDKLVSAQAIVTIWKVTQWIDVFSFSITAFQLNTQIL